MLWPGAPLGIGQVVPAIALVQVRSFDPDRILRRLHPAVDQDLARPYRLEIRQIDLLHPDGAMPLVAGSARRQVVVHQVNGAVCVEEERRVDALHPGQPVRIGPGTGRVARGRDEVAAAVHRRGDHIEHAVVMRDSRREDAARHAQTIEIELGGTVDYIADLLPVHQIDALEHRDAREVGEAGIDQVEAPVRADDARVGMEASQNRVAVVTGWKGCLKGRVVTRIFEPVEVNRRRGRRRSAQWRHRRRQQQNDPGHQQTHQRTSTALRESSKGPAGAPLLSRSVQTGPSAQQ